MLNFNYVDQALNSESFDYLDYVLKSENLNRAIGLMSRVFADGPGDRGSIRGRVIPKTQKMVLDVVLFNNQR